MWFLCKPMRLCTLRLLLKLALFKKSEIFQVAGSAHSQNLQHFQKRCVLPLAGETLVVSHSFLFVVRSYYQIYFLSLCDLPLFVFFCFVYHIRFNRRLVPDLYRKDKALFFSIGRPSKSLCRPNTLSNCIHGIPYNENAWRIPRLNWLMPSFTLSAWLTPSLVSSFLYCLLFLI